MDRKDEYLRRLEAKIERYSGRNEIDDNWLARQREKVSDLRAQWQGDKPEEISASDLEKVVAGMDVDVMRGLLLKALRQNREAEFLAKENVGLEIG